MGKPNEGKEQKQDTKHIADKLEYGAIADTFNVSKC